MADREFETEEARQAYLAGVEDTAKKLQGAPLTMADVRAMKPAEIAKRKKEVHDAIRRHDEGADGGDKDDEATS